MMRSFTVAACLLAAISPDSLRAQVLPGKGEVQRRLDRGSVFIQQDNCAAAVREFDVIDPYFRQHGDLPTFRWNYARCLVAVERPADALASFEFMLTSELPDGTRRAVAKEIEHLRGRVLTDLTIECTPAGSTVEIDGVTELPLPCPARLEHFTAGTYAFRVLSPGDVSHVHRQRIAAGGRIVIRIEVPPELVVRSPVDGAYVQIDGRYAGSVTRTDPLVRRDLKAGRHEIRVTSPAGGKPWVTWVDAAPGQRTTASAELNGARFVGAGGGAVEADDSDDSTLMWVGIGVGAAVVAGAAVTAAVLLSAEEPEERTGLRIAIE